MQVLVLGSGVIGTSVAYYLARAGHEVRVIDRQPGPGLETSYANAGQISPGYSAPWAGPGVPLKAIQWLLMKNSPLVVRAWRDPAMWRWGLQMLSNCTLARYQVNKSRMVRLAEYSRTCLRELRAELGIAYDHRTQGTLQLFRTQQQLDAVVKDTEILQRYGVPFQVLDVPGYLTFEPALSGVSHQFPGALRLPDDETGDCFLFTQRLAQASQALGVQYRFGVRIDALHSASNQITGVQTSEALLVADRYVLALGSYSTGMLAPLGVRLPVYPVKGYSLTMPITHLPGAPQSTVMDETHKVAVTRLGDRIRVGGTAGLCSFDLSLDAKRRQTLEFVVNDLFPHAGDMSRCEFWCGLRPMTPDGTPIIGATVFNNLFLSTGHGTLGWTMACGTGQLVADLVSRRTPAIDTEGLLLDRFESSNA